MAPNYQDRDHPENDLTSDADYANLRPRAPRSAEDLASQIDPLEQRRRNEQSTRQAIAYALGVPVATFVTAFVLAWVSRLIGGPLCDAGTATWICSRAAEIWWPALTSVVAFGGVIGCALILYRKYRNYTRWRGWMGALWFLIPFSMLWMTTVGTMAITGH